MAKIASWWWYRPENPFGARDLAAALNGLTTEGIQAIQPAARRAARIFDADAETAKVVRLFERLLPAQPQ